MGIFIEKDKVEEVKALLNQETVTMVLIHIGMTVCRNHKFSIRDEKTPSVSIRHNGYLYDFGGTFRGSLIDYLMAYKQLTFQGAVSYIAICLGVEI